MIDLFYILFGEGKDLTILQIGSRTVIAFLYALFVIRIAGRRSFGIGAPFDNIITVLLGSILARGVLGVSPFLNTMFSALVIALLHRLFAYITLKPSTLSNLFKGKSIKLVEEGVILNKNMKKCLISIEDLKEGLRAEGHSDDIREFKAIMMERNGRIGIVKK